MNKRQRKKNKKKQEMFIASWVNSYKELKKSDRSYHEFVISAKRKKYDEDWLNKVVYAWNDIPEKYPVTISGEWIF